MRPSTLACLVLAAAAAACTSSTTTGTTGSGEQPPPGSKPQPPSTGPAEEPDPVDPTTDPNAKPCTGQPGELYALNARKLAGTEDIPLCRFKGSVLLIVNVASYCGYTPHYGGMQKLYDKYKAQGLYVLGFPSKSFNQENDNEKEISTFCTDTYKITFPMFTIGNVNPPDEQPVYTWLKAQPGVGGDIPWNFEKFLIARDGKAVKRFAYTMDPDPDKDTTIEDAIKAELAKP